MIKVEHLSRRYGAKLALDDLSFTAGNGSVLGFIGPEALRFAGSLLPEIRAKRKRNSAICRKTLRFMPG